MKAQLFIYTRTKNVDYQAVISPTEDLCPKETRKLFLTQARGVINVEQFDDPLVDARWLFSKKDNLLLWGVGISNSTLSEEIYKDFTGRPVRGFFGIVIDLSQQEGIIPFDIDFFKKIYSTYIIPIWDIEFDSFKKSSMSIDCDIEQFQCIKANASNVNLNCDIDKTQILGAVELSKVFSSALSVGNDTSIVSGFSSKAHAFAHEYYYMNAVITGIELPETKVHKKQSEIQLQPTPTPRPKKVYRPMLIIAIVSAIVLLTILLCTRGNKNSNPSSSGEKEMNNEETMKVSKDSSKISETVSEIPKKP